MEFGLFDYYHVPCKCVECGGVMVFKGVGEYHCEECGAVAYDDYGKVRLYLEEHKGANVVEVEHETGVSQKSIRQMLRESRLQVAENSRTFLNCEICKKTIRSGRVCPECELKVHRKAEEQMRKVKNLQGFGTGQSGESGQRRFMREND